MFYEVTLFLITSVWQRVSKLVSCKLATILSHRLYPQLIFNDFLKQLFLRTVLDGCL